MLKILYENLHLLHVSQFEYLWILLEGHEQVLDKG